MTFEGQNNERQFSEASEKSHWTCSAGGDTFKGETEKVDQLMVFDSWFTQAGERKHARYTSAMSVADSNFETDIYGVNDQVNGRAITQSDAYYAFKGTLNGAPVDYSLMGIKGHEKLSARDAGGNFIDIERGTTDYKSAMKQFEQTNFDPPCAKPEG